MSTRTILTNALGGKCQKCGTTERLQLHHIDKNHKNNNISNILVLCHSCHTKFHHPISAFGAIVDVHFVAKPYLVKAFDEALEKLWIEDRTTAFRQFMRQTIAEARRQ